jgi:4-hydroxy-3-polyprenylbenzoate decarboxylase
MIGKCVTSMREVIENFGDEFIAIDKEIDPVYEIAGIQQSLQDSYGLLFGNIKGFPGVRLVGNPLGKEKRVAEMFNVYDPKKLKFKCVEAMRHPIPPRVVKDAPCQEVVSIDSMDLRTVFPVIKHTPYDGAHVSGGGIMLAAGKVAHNGSDLNFKRMHFRGKDWATIWMGPHEHVTDILTGELRGEKIPITINICAPPSTLLVAGASFIHSVVPHGSDELGFAGAVQECPVDIIKAKTIDAYAIANAEWVIEGYISSSDRAWETTEAEEKGMVVHREEAPPFFPEWHGHMGRAMRVYKFQATALTCRKNPIFYAPHARSIEADIIAAPFREACFWELFERLEPGFVQDVSVMPGVASWGAFVIFQVKKRRPRDEGVQKTLLSACFQHPILQMAIAIDEDVDIYDSRDVMWAIATRVDPENIILAPPRPEVFQGVYPARRGIGLDATTPFDKKGLFERAKYPTSIVDLEKWISKDKIEEAGKLQSEYAKMLAKTGH